jgi:ParB family chromosome partitioning protein
MTKAKIAKDREAFAHGRWRDDASIPENIANEVGGTLLTLFGRRQQEAIARGEDPKLKEIEEAEKQAEAAKIIIDNGYNVRQTENFIKQLKKKAEQGEKEGKDANISDRFKIAVEDVHNRLKSSLGTNVKLVDKGGKGKIVIDYFSAEERERLIKYLTKD